MLFVQLFLMKVLLPSKHINLESTLKQHWSSTFINVVSTLIFGWKWELSRCPFIDVVSALGKWRSKNVERITSIQRRWTNIVSKLKFGWKWKLSRRMFIDVVSTLTKQRWKNYVDSMSMTQSCFNVDIQLKIKIESTYVHRRCFDVDKTALKQLCQYLLYWCSLQSGEITKQSFPVYNIYFFCIRT